MFLAVMGQYQDYYFFFCFNSKHNYEAFIYFKLEILTTICVCFLGNFFEFEV